MRHDEESAPVVRGIRHSARERDGVHLQQIIETQRAIAAPDLDLGAIMGVICARTQELTGAQGAAVLLAEGNKQLRYAAGSGSFEIDVGETVPIHGSAAGSMFKQESAVVGEFDDGCRLGVALQLGDRAIGVLMAAASSPGVFDEDDARTLGLLSVLLTAALSNDAALEAKRAQVETELVRRENSKLAKIVETQRDIAAVGLDLEAVMTLIAERALLLTQAEGAAVNLIDGDDVIMRASSGIATKIVGGARRPLADSVTGHAATTGRTILIEDSANDERLNQDIVASLGERSHVCVPLFSGGEVVGSLSVMSTSETEGLHEEDRQTLELLGVVLSSAVTAAAEFEAKRRQVEALKQFEFVWKHAPVGIQIVNLDGRVTAANPAMLAIYGHTADELSSMLVDELIHLEDAPRVHDEVARLTAGNCESDTTELGYRLRVARGEISLSSSRSLIRDASGSPLFMLGMVEDVTTRKAAEEQLHQSQRIEAIGQLSAGIAHDFNNLLLGVLGYTGLARSEVEQDSGVAGYLDQIEETAQRAASLTKQLLAFGGRQTMVLQEVDLNAFVSDTVEMLERLLGERIEIVTRLDPTLPALLADPTQIQQVLLNLALNARDAMPDGGVLTIETEQVAVGLDQAVRTLDLEPGHYLALTVDDTGEGMSAEVKERIFEPFYTTKDVGKGTGLGLSSVYGIVKQSHGDIEVTSELSGGSTFRIYLPTTEAAIAQDRADGRPRILMVEDSDVVRMVLERVIADRGYDIVAAEDSERALELLQHEAPFDLLLSDIVLPGMNGVDLAARIQELQPSIRVLFMSGYPREHRVDPALLLAKPFSNESLLAKIESTLGELATAS